MKRVLLIGVYFGKLPYFCDLLFKSIAANPDIDWLIFSDQPVPALPSLRVINLSMAEFVKQIGSKWTFGARMDRGFKVADYRPFFWLLLDNYIEGYDYWGYFDFDMVFGKMRKFLDPHLGEADVISVTNPPQLAGCLCIYRNAPVVNHHSLKICNFHQALLDTQHYAHDDGAMAQIVHSSNLVYRGGFFPFVGGSRYPCKLEDGTLYVKNGRVWQEALANHLYRTKITVDDQGIIRSSPM